MAAIFTLVLLGGLAAPASAQVFPALPGAAPGEICEPEIFPVPGTSFPGVAPRAVLGSACVEAPPPTAGLPCEPAILPFPLSRFGAVTPAGLGAECVVTPPGALPVPNIPMITLPGLGGPAAAAQGPQASGVDWGVNRNGWQLTIANSGRDWLFRGIQDPFDNIASAPDAISAGSEGLVRGTGSIFGGPANMNVRYQAYRYVAGRRENVGGVLVRISSAYVGGGCPPIVPCQPNVKLTVTCDQSGELRCTVLRAVANQPVLVQVTAGP